MKQKHYIVGLYYRKSQEDERQGESISIENQRIILRKYAEKACSTARKPLTDISKVRTKSEHSSLTKKDLLQLFCEATLEVIELLDKELR